MIFDISDSSVYLLGAARFDYLIYLVTQDKELLKDDVAHSRFIGFQRGQLGHIVDENWTAVGLAVVKKPREKLVAVGENGQVLTYLAGKKTSEEIPAPVSALRSVGVIDGHAFCCGMKREVFRRMDEGEWIAMHAPAPEGDQIAGFEGIDGFSYKEAYAVGWSGEIWQWSGTRWMQQDSPTSSILTAVCCAGDKQVYACGKDGVLVCGRNDEWAVIAEGHSEDFWDLCWFGGSLYVSSMTDLFRLEKNHLVPVDMGEDRPSTFNKITHAEGVMWTVGASDVFSFDGESWFRVD